MQRLSMSDSRWGTKTFGVPGSPLTIAWYGCTITSLANLTDSLTPLDIARSCSFQPDALLVWSSISNVPGLTFMWRQWDSNYQVIVDRFNQGQKVLIQITLNKSPHWLAVDRINGDILSCINPISPTQNQNIHRNQVVGSAFVSVASQPTPKPIQVVTSEPNPTFVTVVKGDGLISIAEKAGLPFHTPNGDNYDVLREIAKLNGVTNWTWEGFHNSLRAGQSVKVRPDPIVTQVDSIKLPPEPVQVTGVSGINATNDYIPPLSESTNNPFPRPAPQQEVTSSSANQSVPHVDLSAEQLAAKQADLQNKGVQDFEKIKQEWEFFKENWGKNINPEKVSFQVWLLGAIKGQNWYVNGIASAILTAVTTWLSTYQTQATGQNAVISGLAIAIATIASKAVKK
jgi:hypothetical protein